MPQQTDFRRLPILPAVILLVVAGLASCGPESPPWTSEETTALHHWLDAHPGGPSGLTVEELRAGRSVVFLQDNVLRRDSILMLRGMLPSIHDAGVREIGVFFLESEAQAAIDATINREPEEEPRELIRMANPRLGYREYGDFLRYVRDFNSRVPDEQDRIRIVGLDNRGTMDSGAVNRLLTGGNEDSGDSEPPEIRPAFLWIRAEDRESLPETDAALLAHYRPASGILDSVLQERDLRDRSFAFRADEEPFASWDHLILPEDGQIIVVTPFELSAVTPIEDFITEEDLDVARRFFPDTGNDNRPAAQARAMNRAIAREARRYAASID